MKTFDLISEKVHFKYQGYNNHPSSLGLCFSIIIFVLTVAFGVYSIRELWQKRKPMVNIVSKYSSDAGTYQLGIGNINHFFYFEENGNVKFDPKAYTIEAVKRDFNLVEKAKYFYSKCIWDLDGVDFHEFTNVKREIYEQSFCIRTFLNLTSGETIHLNKETVSTFPYPIVSYGTASSVDNAKKFAYLIDVKECRNTTASSDCYPPEKIKEIRNNQNIYYGFIDKKFDVMNYKNPIKNQYNQIEGKLSSTSYSANHLNINPSTIDSDDGFIMEERKIYRNVYLYQNEKIVNYYSNKDDSEIRIIAKVNYWLKNQETIYIRTYVKLQDTMAKIGGFFNFIYYSALLLNFFPNRYVTIVDLANLFFQNGLTLTNILSNKILEKSMSSSFTSKNDLKTIKSNNLNLNNLNNEITDNNQKSFKVIKRNNDNFCEDYSLASNNRINKVFNKQLSQKIEEKFNDQIKESNQQENQIEKLESNHKQAVSKILLQNYCNKINNKTQTFNNVSMEKNLLNINFSFLDMFFYPCNRNKLIYKLVEKTKTMILSEESIVKMVFDAKKKEILLFSYKETEMMNSMQIRFEELFSNLNTKV